MCFASFLVNYPKNTSVGKEKVSKQYKNSKKKRTFTVDEFQSKRKVGMIYFHGIIYMILLCVYY